MFVADFPKTSAELKKPNQEIVAIYTNNTSSSGIIDLKKYTDLKSSFYFIKYQNQIGTRLTLHDSTLETRVKDLSVSLEGFYNSNYDVIAKIPNRKTIVRRIKIKTISKYSPKIVLD